MTAFVIVRPTTRKIPTMDETDPTITTRFRRAFRTGLLERTSESPTQINDNSEDQDHKADRPPHLCCRGADPRRCANPSEQEPRSKQRESNSETGIRNVGYSYRACDDSDEEARAMYRESAPTWKARMDQETRDYIDRLAGQITRRKQMYATGFLLILAGCVLQAVGVAF